MGGEGAAAAVSAALQSLCGRAKRWPTTATLPDASEMADVLAEALGAVGAEAARHCLPIEEFACTLIVVVVRGNSIVATQVGDGAVVVRQRAEAAALVTRPAHGTFINETVFLTSENAIDRMQCVQVLDDVNAVAVFTDGLEQISLVSAGSCAHEPFFAPLFSWLSASSDVHARQRALSEFLRSDPVRRKTDDDLTLVVAVDVPEPRSSGS